MKLETKMFNVVNRNHDCKILADKLNAISARRCRKKSKKISRPPEVGVRKAAMLECNPTLQE